MLKGRKAGRLWPKARLRDRIDAIIAHEWAEAQHLDHQVALKAAARTELPVSEGARRILRAIGEVDGHAVSLVRAVPASSNLRSQPQ